MQGPLVSPGSFGSLSSMLSDRHFEMADNDPISNVDPSLLHFEMADNGPASIVDPFDQCQYLTSGNSYNPSEAIPTIEKLCCLKMQATPGRIKDARESGVKARITYSLLEENVAKSSNDTSTKFHIGNSSRNALSDMIHNLTTFNPKPVSSFMESLNSTAPFFESIADVTTALLRSFETNPAVENITGYAFGPETYIRVRWQWFLMPVSVVFLSTMFLILTILQSWHQEHLYRSSTLAELFHGLEGWDTNELKLETGSGKVKETDSRLLEKAKHMKVTLKENDEGILKFMKAH
ncbi:MAG: hypothetical protein Q9160_006576 [Pyrenula sp. 1 TL-2023]